MYTEVALVVWLTVVTVMVVALARWYCIIITRFAAEWQKLQVQVQEVERGIPPCTICQNQYHSTRQHVRWSKVELDSLEYNLARLKGREEGFRQFNKDGYHQFTSE